MNKKEIARYQALVMRDALERRGLVLPRSMEEFAICPAFMVVVPEEEFRDSEVIGVWMHFREGKCGFDEWAGERDGLNLMGTGQIKIATRGRVENFEPTTWAMMGKGHPTQNMGQYLESFGMNPKTPAVGAVVKYLHRCYYPVARMSSSK